MSRREQSLPDLIDDPALVFLRIAGQRSGRARWTDLALCRELGDPDFWFPQKGESTAIARRICGQCPVSEQCLEEALATGPHHGIWGGTSERERRRMHGGREAA